CQQYDSFPLSF
nr:immunoglobulin light chain junction region [Macaca mulatta]